MKKEYALKKHEHLFLIWGACCGVASVVFVIAVIIYPPLFVYDMDLRLSNLEAQLPQEEECWEENELITYDNFYDCYVGIRGEIYGDVPDDLEYIGFLPNETFTCVFKLTKTICSEDGEGK